MGFYLRKSINLGPFRFNLSNSGVGASVRVRGFRVGTGPRGNYVHVGRGGVYYRHTLPNNAPPPAAQQEVDSQSADCIVDASSEELLEEIRAKRRTMRWRPLAIVLSIVVLLMTIGAGSPLWLIASAAVLGVALLLITSHRDRTAKTVVVHYEFEPAVEAAFQRFSEWAQALASCNRAWSVTSSVRNITSIQNTEPPFFQTNVPVLSIGAGRQRLYFLPDRLLIYDANGVGAVSYRSLNITTSQQRYIEDSTVPSDAVVVDTTWRHVTKKGGPDRRFSHNPQLPICLYDEITLHTPSGLQEVIQLSRVGVAEGFIAALRHLATV